MLVYGVRYRANAGTIPAARPRERLPAPGSRHDHEDADTTHRAACVNTVAYDGTAQPAVRAATHRASLRDRLRLWALVADIGAAFVGYEIAVVFFAWFHHYELHFATQSLDWGIPVGFFAILGSFAYCGLYKLEAWVSRPLHVFLLLKGTLIAVVITAAVAFTFRAPFVTDSRLTVFTAFVVFFALALAARLWLLDRMYRRDVAERPGHTLVIGASSDSGVLVEPPQGAARLCPSAHPGAARQAAQRLRRRARPAARRRRDRAGPASGVHRRGLRGLQGHLRPHRRRPRPRLARSTSAGASSASSTPPGFSCASSSCP